MATNYPASIDTEANLPTVKDGSTPIKAAILNQLRDAVIQIQYTVGANPADTYGNVKNRLDAIVAGSGSGNFGSATITAGGIDSVGALNIGTGTATSINIGHGIINTTITGNLTVSGTTTINMVGDVTGTSAASVVSRISGSSPIVITPATLQWTAGTTSPTLFQPQQTSDILANSINITAQQPFTGATGSNRISGGINLNYFAPDGYGSEQFVRVKRSGSSMIAFGGQNANFAGMWTNGNESSQSAYTIIGSTTSTYLSAPNGAIIFSINDSQRMRMSSGTFRLGGATINLEAMVFDLNTNIATQHFTEFASSANITYDESQIGDGYTLTIKGQDGYHLVNSSGGNIVINPGSKHGIGTDGYIVFPKLGGNGTGVVGVDNIGNLFFSAGAGGSFTAAHDLSGTSSSQTVIGLQGNPIKAVTLGSVQDGYVLSWVNADGYLEMKPAPSGSFTAGGDLGGNSSSQQVITITGSGGVATVVNGTSLSLIGATSAASTGKLRVSKDFTFNARNSGDSADYNILNFNGSNSLSIGDTTLGGALNINSGASGMVLNVQGGGSLVTQSLNVLFRDSGANIKAEIDAGTHSAFSLGSAADFAVMLAAYPGAETTNSGIWFLANGGTRTAGNISLYGDGSNTSLAGSGSVLIGINGSNYFRLRSSEIQFGTSYVLPEYIFDLSTTAVQHFGVSATSATIQYDAQTSDVATADLTLTAQAPFASAVTHLTPGMVVISIPPVVGAGTVLGSGMRVDYNSSAMVRLGASSTAYGALWMGTAAVSPSAINHTITSAGGTTYFNSTSQLNFDISNSDYAAMSSSQWLFGGINTSAATSYIDFSATTVYHFGVAASSAKILYDQSTTGNGNALTIRAQDGYVTHPATGGDLVLSSGAGNSSTNGNINFQGGGTTVANIEGTHGKVTAGGSGSDYKVEIGPCVGAETTDAALYLLANGTSPLIGNSVLKFGSGFDALWAYHNGSIGLQAPGTGGSYGDILFQNANGNVGTTEVLGRFDGASGSLILPYGVAVGSGTVAASDIFIAGGLAAVIHFQTTATTSATIKYDAQTADTATATLAIRGQDAYPSATTNKTGGNLTLRGGAGKTAADRDGYVDIGSAFSTTRFTGATSYTVISVASNITVGSDGYNGTIFVVDTTSARTLTLPVPVSGYSFWIIDKSNNAEVQNITLARYASEKIDGVAANLTLQTSGGRWMVVSDGTDWYSAAS